MTEETTAVEATPAQAGMFGAAQEVAPEATPEQVTGEVVSAEQAITTGEGLEWHWSEGIKGEGERPEWLKEKYQSVSDQAVAYNELEKKFGEFKGAPKDGYDLSKLDGVDAEDPVLKSLGDTFKELNLSQAGFERVIAEYGQHMGSLEEIDIQAEIKKLGPQGQAMVNQTNQWLKNTIKDDAIRSTVDKWIQTADDVKALDIIRSMQPLSRSPTANEQSSTLQYESLGEVKNEKTSNWTRYKDDVNYRKSLDQRMIMAEHRQTAQGKR